MNRKLLISNQNTSLPFITFLLILNILFLLLWRNQYALVKSSISTTVLLFWNSYVVRGYVHIHETFEPLMMTQSCDVYHSHYLIHHHQRHVVSMLMRLTVRTLQTREVLVRNLRYGGVLWESWSWWWGVSSMVESRCVETLFDAFHY